jgi:hypothetical protein
MKLINFRDVVIDTDLVVKPWLRECTPRILIITDGLNFHPGRGFGLTQFADTLRNSQIHGMTPIVKTAARRRPALGGEVVDFANYRLDDPANGVLISRYDVVFFFGFNTEDNGQLDADEVTAITRFMQAGGGVFATGDHEDLGTAQCRDIPRVNKMRFWLKSETPNVANTNRLSTNLPGDDTVFTFEDQSDAHAQRLYPNYRTGVSWLELVLIMSKVRRPHALLQFGRSGVVNSFPDHPHEGECRVPTDLNTTFTLDGADVQEWPAAQGRLFLGGGGRVAPEAVAMTMSFGNGFDSGPTGPKDALVPRSFMAICAYNGHRANVGRVVTDATWHHFVNVNIDGTSSGRNGLRNADGTDNTALVEIRHYYRNLATWLMPKNVRMCLRLPLIINELARFPLFEELRMPVLAEATPQQLRAIGESVAEGLQARMSSDAAQEMLLDVLQDSGIEDALEPLAQTDERISSDLVRGTAFAALGAVVIATTQQLETLRDKEKVDVHAVFTKATAQAAQQGARTYLATEVEQLRKSMRALEKLAL